MSGGGSKGAYEAGVINGFVNGLDPEDVKYDVVSGVSAGAINAVFVSLFEKGEEKQMSEAMLQLFYNMTNDHVWTEWGDGIIEDIFNHSGFLDDSPLFNMITNIVNKAGSIKRKLVVAADNSIDGSYVLFTETLPFE